MKLPTNKGVCSTCSDKNNCPMNDMLKEWKIVTDQYGDDVKNIRPDLWEEYSIDQPTIKNNQLIWCPMYNK